MSIGHREIVTMPLGNILFGYSKMKIKKYVSMTVVIILLVVCAIQLGLIYSMSRSYNAMRDNTRHLEGTIENLNLKFGMAKYMLEDKADYVQWIVKYSTQYKVDPRLILALMRNESGYNPRAVQRRTKCAGLMQIHPIHKLENVFDPETNILYGIRLYKNYQDKHGERGAMFRYGNPNWDLIIAEVKKMGR